MAEDLAALKKARSMLLILLATCQQTSIALAAAANDVDSQFASELDAVIERTKAELGVLDARLADRDVEAG